VDYSRCELIRRRLEQQERLAADLQNDLPFACSGGPQEANCAAVTADLQSAVSRVIQLRNQYRMCMMAASSQAGLQPLWPNTP
jgi:hypothetical protein